MGCALHGRTAPGVALLDHRPVIYDAVAAAHIEAAHLRSPIARYHPPRSEELSEVAVADTAPLIALVDADWTILATNTAWTDMLAQRSAQLHLRVGDNYRRFCETNPAFSTPEAALVTAGLRAIDRGEARHFQHSCRAYDGGSDVQLSISKIGRKGREHAVISCFDMSGLAQWRRKQIDLGSKLLVAQDEERQRVTRDFHDTAAQHLIGMSLALANLRAISVDPAINSIAADLSLQLSQFQSELRGMTYIMHPPALQAGGLRSAVKSLCAGFARRTGVLLNLRVEANCRARARMEEATIYRLIQEALSNVHRHAGAQRVNVRLSIRSDMLVVVVKDDGVGLPKRLSIGENSASFGVGIAGMIARVADLGGRLQVRSRGRDRGTVIAAFIPHDACRQTAQRPRQLVARYGQSRQPVLV